MATLPQRWQKLVLGLGSAAVVTLFLAVFVKLQDFEQTQFRFDERLMISELGSSLDKIEIIRIASGQRVFDIVKKDNGDWVLPGKSGFWADKDYVRQLLLALKDLKLVDEKSRLPESHTLLGLEVGDEDDAGVRYTLLDDEDKVYADIVVGDRQVRATGDDVFYVRYAEDAQAYLAKGRLNLRQAEEDWIDLSIVEIDRDDVQAVDVKIADGTAYTISRKDVDDAFVLLPVPDGNEVKSQYALNSVAYALVTMNVEDVLRDLPDGAVPQGEFVYTLFSGIAIKGEVSSADDIFWVQFSLLEDGPLDESHPNFAAADVLLRRFRERAEGYVFKLPQFKADQFTRPLSELIAPVEEADVPSPEEPNLDLDLDLDLDAGELDVPVDQP